MPGSLNMVGSIWKLKIVVVTRPHCHLPSNRQHLGMSNAQLHSSKYTCFSLVTRGFFKREHPGV